jgi:hypothetical protein
LPVLHRRWIGALCRFAQEYELFAEQWAAYQAVADRVVGLARAGEGPQAVASYNTGSRSTFDESSDILSRLTDQTVVKARRDSERAAATYSRARKVSKESGLDSSCAFP